LTDNDIRELAEAAGLSSASGLEEVLGRVSQLIEELPWLVGLEARIPQVGSTRPERFVLGGRARLGFRAGAATPPL